MIGWVDAWLAEYADRLRARGLAVEVRRSPADRPKQSIAVLLDAGGALGQLIVWDTGEAVTDFVDAASGPHRSQHWHVSDAASVENAMAALLKQLENAVAGGV
ncbi:immunity protein TriTu family protein [Yinghuangia sp. YIM S09857]|uniref:immunity protein TriTu family protein n=1 Tax=Yinghuangia sp. YIM S09857 TaxID=3436929 RepID=UPI003F535A20